MVEFLLVGVIGPYETDEGALLVGGDVHEVGFVNFVDENLAAELYDLLVVKVLDK